MQSAFVDNPRFFRCSFLFFFNVLRPLAEIPEARIDKPTWREGSKDAVILTNGKSDYSTRSEGVEAHGRGFVSLPFPVCDAFPSFVFRCYFPLVSGIARNSVIKRRGPLSAVPWTRRHINSILLT